MIYCTRLHKHVWRAHVLDCSFWIQGATRRCSNACFYICTWRSCLPLYENMLVQACVRDFVRCNLLCVKHCCSVVFRLCATLARGRWNLFSICIMICTWNCVVVASHTTINAPLLLLSPMRCCYSNATVALCNPYEVDQCCVSPIACIKHSQTSYIKSNCVWKSESVCVCASCGAMMSMSQLERNTFLT